MKKVTTVIVLSICFGAIVHAQSSITFGFVGGGGANAFLDKNTDKNNTHLNAAVGFDLGCQIWRGLYIGARSEYQRRYYLLDPYLANTYNNQNYWATRAAITHQLGLGWRTRLFYTNIGATFTDDISGGEQYNPDYLLCGLMTPQELALLEKPSYETFNNWGVFFRTGFTPKIGAHTRLITEIQWAQERSANIKSNYLQAFGALGARMGLQFEL